MSEEATKAEQVPQETGAEPEGDASPPEPQQVEQKESEEAKEEQQPADSAEPPKQESEGDKQEQAAEPEPKQKEEEEKEEEQLADEEEPEDGVPIVLVTGASGFIATHIIQQLLQQGRFRVRGTVRSLKNEPKVQPLRDLVPDAKYPLRLIEADLQKPKTWQLAVKRCVYVFHVASPFPFKQPKNADEVIRPAVDGTLNVLKACSEAGTVKRVALTSSVAAVSSGLHGNPGNPPDYVYTEKDWSDESSCGPYEKSKLLAERAAWDFVKELEEDKRFELTVLNPGYVQGPFLSKSSGGSSAELGTILLNNKGPLVNMTFSLIDVRDVAAAHIAAIEKDDAAGQRHLLVATSLHAQQVAAIVDAEFKPQGYKVPRKVLGKVGSWIGKFVNSSLKSVYKDLGKSVKHSNERMRNVLGVEPKTIEDTMRDTCYSLIELGLVKKTPGYLGHPSTRPPPPPAEEQQQETKEDKPAQEPAQEEAKTEEPAQGEQQAPQEEEKQEEPVAKEPQKEEEPPKEEPPKEEPPKEEPPKEEPQKEEPPKEEPPKEEPPKEEPPKEEPQKEEPPKEEPQEEEPPKEEPPKEETQTEDAPQEESPKEDPSPVEPQQEEEQKPADPEPNPETPPPQEETADPPKETTPPPEPTQEQEPAPEPSQEET